MISNLLSTLLISTSPAEAKLFRNSYVSFELPNNWNCTMKNTEWLCRSLKDKERREAIIVLTAKSKNAGDNLEEYQNYLKTPRQVVLSPTLSLKSEVQDVELRTINAIPWVDGWHYESELKNYYTRYVATVKSKLAILVTFSAHRKQYTKYSRDFFKAIQSLRVVADPKADSIAQASGLSKSLSGTGTLGSQLSQSPNVGFGDLGLEEPSDSDQKSSGLPIQKLVALFFLLSGIGAYFYVKKSSSK